MTPFCKSCVPQQGVAVEYQTVLPDKKLSLGNLNSPAGNWVNELACDRFHADRVSPEGRNSLG
jgi:hypothetical protein